MIINIIGLIAGPLMMKTGIMLLQIIGLIWTIGSGIGTIMFIISLFNTRSN